MTVRRTNEALGAVLLLGLTTMLAGCQSPTEPDDVIAVDDFVEASVTPDPAEASTSTGRTYRVVRGNNQPDDILEYDWKTTFTIAILVNETANDDDLDLAFPLDVTAATVKAQQASGGIVTPPGSGELEYSDFTITSSSGSRFAAANATNTITFDVWYDFPNLRREALMTVSVAMKDADGRTFTKIKEVRVAP